MKEEKIEHSIQRVQSTKIDTVIKRNNIHLTHTIVRSSSLMALNFLLNRSMMAIHRTQTFRIFIIIT
jgi:hypothetical protein